MPTVLAQSLERDLRAARSALIPAPYAGEFVLPWYDGRSLANVPATISSLLGQPPIGSLPPLDDAYWRDSFGQVDHVVLVLLDALGYLQLQEMLAQEPNCSLGRLSASGQLLPMTSVCPSTTATALVTLGTAASPASHGMLGYELYLREYAVLIEMLGLRPVYGESSTQLLDWGYAPETFVPVPGVGDLLRPLGVRSTAHVAQQFATSALTRACYRGFDQVIGHAGLPSLWENVAADLRAAGEQRSYHYAYWGGIDKAIHAYGAEDDAWRLAFIEVADTLNVFLDGLKNGGAPANTLVVVCADHGFVSSPAEAAFVSEEQPFSDLLLVPYSGESRLTYLHTLRGVCDESQQALQAALGDDFVVMSSQDALTGGFFGPGAVYSETLFRLGHYVALARGQRYIDRLGRAAWMRGRHGGLSPEEMLVPWLATRVDALC